MKNFFKSESKENKFEKLLAEIGIFPNAVMDAFNDYSIICKKSDSEIFEYLVDKTSSEYFCQTGDCTAITLRILAHLLGKFRDNDNDKIEIPINFEKNYFKAVKNIEDLILFQKKEYRYFEYFEDVDFVNFLGDGFSGYSYRIYKKEAPKIKDYLKFIDNESGYKEFLEKFELEEKQAFTIFGKYWYYILSQNDDTLYWNVQRSILRIKRSSNYRMRLEPYFESTIEFFEKVFLNNSELNLISDFQFNDVFMWNYDLSFEDSDDTYFWNYYKIFGQKSGKYSKIFEDIINSHYNPGSKYEESDNEESDNEENYYEESYDKVLNAYNILKINHTSTLKEIHTKYRKLCLKYHPDKNKSSDANEVMMKINDAYQILRLKFE